jgi:Ca2+-binding EF-hand superfamily protein
VYNTQIVFFWTLLARQASLFFIANPLLRPELPALSPALQASSSIPLSAQQERQIKDAFELFDTDGGGTIDSRELSVTMCALGLQNTSVKRTVRRETSRRMLEAIDSDQSNSISLEQFTRMMKGELTQIDPLHEIRVVFAGLCSLEAEDPGVVGLSKLRVASRAYNVRLSEQELRMMIEEVDHDGSGAVDEAEFIRIMSLSPWF